MSLVEAGIEESEPDLAASTGKTISHPLIAGVESKVFRAQDVAGERNRPAVGLILVGVIRTDWREVDGPNMDVLNGRVGREEIFQVQFRVRIEEVIQPGGETIFHHAQPHGNGGVGYGVAGGLQVEAIFASGSVTHAGKAERPDGGCRNRLGLLGHVLEFARPKAHGADSAAKREVWGKLGVLPV